jgi:ATP-dependent RNA helicase RhlE
MSLENLKLSKQLLTAMLDAGYLSPKEIQSKTISRIVGGQNIVAIGPEGCGKTTSYVLSVLMRLREHVDGPPRALILVPDREKVLELTALFKWLGKNTGIKISCLTSGLEGDHYLETIEDGQADIVIGTPDRINTLYIKSTLNLRSLMVFVVDDTEMIFKLNLQAPVYNLSEGLPKCQRLVFAEVVNEKLNKLTEQLMPIAVQIEVQGIEDHNQEVIDMILYKVSNYKTKLNLLEQMLRDSDEFAKVAVFVNTRATAETLYNNLNKRLGKTVALLNRGSYNSGFDSLEDIKQSSERIIILSSEDQPSFNLLEIPHLFHMEIPLEKEVFIKRIKKLNSNNGEENKAVSITFATNSELNLVKKIEQTIGKKMTEIDGIVG